MSNKNSIQNRLIFNMAVTIIIGVTAFFVAFFTIENKFITSFVIKPVVEVFEGKEATIQEYLGNIKKDIILISMGPVINNLADSPRDRQIKQYFSFYFKETMRKREDILKMRFLSSAGEILQFNRFAYGIEELSEAGEFEEDDEEVLKIAGKMKEGEAFFSGIELYKEKNKLILPYSASIKVISPVYSKNKLLGAIIAYINLSSVFEKILNSERGCSFYVGDDAGNYIFSADRLKLFGKFFNTGVIFYRDFPFLGKSADRGGIVVKWGRIFIYDKFVLDKNMNFPQIALVLEIDKKNFLRDISPVKPALLLLAFFFVGTTVFIIYMQVKRAFAPIEELSEFARSISLGTITKKRFVYKKDDEIGDLAKSFNIIIARLQETIDAIRYEKERLEIEVKNRTKHLEDEIAKNKEKEKVLLELSEKLRKSQKAILNMLEDLKEEKRIALELKEEAIAASRAKSNFLANMSHEIRTPMNAIIGFIDILEQSGLTDTQKEYVAIIKDSAQLLLSLINDILDISKIEAGKMDFEYIEFDLFILVESVSKIISSKLSGSRVEFFQEYDNRLPVKFYGDPVRIRQILINLLSNAVKFTESGHIKITVSCGKRYVENGKELMNVFFSVIDTGIGIPEEKLGVIFELFTQADVSTTRRYGGTGLGLAITKSLIEKMGGKLSLKSKEGKGSEFSFFLPMEIALKKEMADKRIIPYKGLEGKKIVVFSENKSSADILAQYICAKGHECERVFDFNKIPRDADLVIFDFQKISDDVKKQVAELKQFGVKSMIVTADADAGKAGESERAGFSAYLSKPVSSDEFVEVILNVLSEEVPFVTRHTVKEAGIAGISVLVAEDNDINFKLIKIILERFGCNVDRACDGKDVVDKVRYNRYDIVLMDMQMPVMGGCEASRIIRNELKSTIPIIALTAAVMEEDKDMAKASGMDDFLPKPINPGQLKEKILKVLRGL